MQFSGGASIAARLRGLVRSGLGVALVCMPLLATAPVAAAAAQSGNQTGNIEVRLCPTPGQSFLSLTEPQTDAVLPDDRVVIRGDASQLAAIEFSVNGVYRTTLEMGESAVGYAQPLRLPPGRQTILAVGYDLCRQTVGTHSVTVTVPPLEATAIPAPPAPVKSLADITADLPVVFREQPSQDADAPGQPQSGRSEQSDSRAPNPATGLSILDTILSNLDIAGTFSSPSNIFRALAAISGASLLALPTLVAGQVGSPAQTIVPKKYFGRKVSTGKLRLLGLVLLAVPFFV